MDKCKANAWSTKNEVATMVAGKFAYTKIKHSTKQKDIAPFPCHVYCEFATTVTGKFMQVNTKRKVDTALV